MGTMNYVQDPRSAKIGGASIVKCTGFSFSETAPLTPLGSDSDKYARAVAVGLGTITSSLTGYAVSGLSLTVGLKNSTGVTVTFQVPQASTAKIAIANSVFGGRSGNIGRGGAGTFTFNCSHYSTSGSTSPITYVGM
jgi:hypothetical protein